MAAGSAAPLTVALPIADRARSFAFYREALGLEAVGEPAGDGIPEPLQFAVNDGLRLMLVPRDGFGGIVLGGRPVAEPGTSECVLSVSADTPGEVDAAVDRARRAGAQVTAEPTQRPWGYLAMFTDPDGHTWMLTSAPS